MKSRYEMGKRQKYAPPRQLMTVDEVERTKREIAQEEEYLEGLHRAPKDELGSSLAHAETSRSVDADAIRAGIARKKKSLERLSPESHKLAGRERQKACDEMSQDEEYLRKHMLTTYEMGAYPPKPSDENYAVKNQKYLQAVEKSKKMEVGNPEFQKRAQRYKLNARRLDPTDPELPNIERFRSTERY